jgi:beta-N-acetylhexosaminidase
MLSNATYPAWDADNAAGWSKAIGTTLLRSSLGFKGVTMTDSLDGTANARGVSTASLAVRAAKAGTDMLLLTGSEASSAAVFKVLYDKARTGAIARTTLTQTYARILALRTGL